jgi:spermidine synthase
VFWTVEATMRSAGLRTVPYRVDGRGACSAGGPERTARGTRPEVTDWGFVLAGRTRPALRLDPAAPPPRSLTRESLAADRRAAARTRLPGLPPSTLVHPRYAD